VLDRPKAGGLDHRRPQRAASAQGCQGERRRTADQDCLEIVLEPGQLAAALQILPRLDEAEA